MTQMASVLRAKGYQLSGQVGAGSFASVYSAVHLKTGRDVAIKVVSKARLLEDDCPIHCIENEIAIMKKLDFPLIAAYIDHFEDSSCHYIVLEHAQGISLFEKLEDGPVLMEDCARNYFAQLLLTFDYLHNRAQVAHRDIKPDNIMIDAYDRIKVIDFGLSKDFTGGTGMFTTACGSIEYASPEMVSGRPYTIKSDLWSLGVVLYVMVTGMLPFTDQNEVKTIKKIIYMTPIFPKTLSSSCVDLLSRMLAKDPEQRISFEEIKNHEWIRDELNSPKWDVLRGDQIRSIHNEVAEDLHRHTGHSSGAMSDCAEYRILRSEKVNRFLSQPPNDIAPLGPGLPFPRRGWKPDREASTARESHPRGRRALQGCEVRLTPKFVSPIAQFMNEDARPGTLLRGGHMRRIRAAGMRVCVPPGRLC